MFVDEMTRDAIETGIKDGLSRQDMVEGIVEGLDCSEQEALQMIGAVVRDEIQEAWVTGSDRYGMSSWMVEALGYEEQEALRLIDSVIKQTKREMGYEV